MSAIGLKIVDADPNDPLGDKRTLLLIAEAEIRAREAKSIEARHQSGSHILTLRTEHKSRVHGVRWMLPAGVRKALVDDIGISSGEINRRTKFAEKYPVSDLQQVCSKYVTWDNVVKHALPEAKSTPTKTRPKGSSLPVSTILRDSLAKIATSADTRGIKPSDVKAIDDAIAALLALKGAVDGKGAKS